MRGVRSILQSVQARADGYLSDKQWRETEYSIRRLGKLKYMRLEWQAKKELYPKEIQDIWEKSFDS